MERQNPSLIRKQVMIEMAKVRVVYPTGGGVELASLTIAPGEFVFLVGPSGAGKTTILRTLYMDLKPVEGYVRVGAFHSLLSKAKEIPYLRRTIGIVFQDFRLFPDRDVFDNVAFALEVTGKTHKEIKKRVLRVLAEVGLSHKARKFPQELSGGEQQRVVLSRAIANEPALILADEPTGNLDPESADGIVRLLERINARGATVVMATHNDEMVKRYRGRVIHIRNGHLSI
jgi:cell division transport system ATP-binding protein